MEWPVFAAVVVLAAVAACIQTLAGFGFALFIAPFLAILIGPRDTVVLATLLSLSSTLPQTLRLRASAERRTVAWLLAGSVTGMPFGLALLLILDADVLKLIIAASVVAFTLLLMRGLQLHNTGRPGDLATGFVAGVLTLSTSMNGPPIVIYLQGKGLAPLQFRATITAFFAAASTISITTLTVSGVVKPHLVLAAALAFPAVWAGGRAGNALFPRVDDRLFRRFVFAILFLSAGMAVVTVVV